MSSEWVDCLCDSGNIHILPIGDCFNRCYFPRDEKLCFNCIKEGPCSGEIEKCKMNHDCWNFINNDCHWRYDCFSGFDKFTGLTSCFKKHYWGDFGIDFETKPLNTDFQKDMFAGNDKFGRDNMFTNTGSNTNTGSDTGTNTGTN